jgi:two-component system, HptB-dependent secretion and biofilm response regulator
MVYVEKLKVLVAEDDAITRETIIDVLGPFSCEIVSAANGAEALELYREHRPDLVLVDFQMPFVNGLTVLKQIKAERSELPVIIMTAIENSNDFFEQARQCGADDCLKKPFDMHVLRNKISSFLTNF